MSLRHLLQIHFGPFSGIEQAIRQKVDLHCRKNPSEGDTILVTLLDHKTRAIYAQQGSYCIERALRLCSADFQHRNMAPDERRAFIESLRHKSLKLLDKESNVGHMLQQWVLDGHSFTASTVLYGAGFPELLLWTQPELPVRLGRLDSEVAMGIARTPVTVTGETFTDTYLKLARVNFPGDFYEAFKRSPATKQ